MYSGNADHHLPQSNRPSVCYLFSRSYVFFSYILFCFLRQEVPDFLQYRVARQKQNSDAIEDIFDGQLYKKHFGEDGFFLGSSTEDKKTQIHLSLQINTDGVAIFGSSKFSIWLVYFIVNELPPNCRYVNYERKKQQCLMLEFLPLTKHVL